MIKRITILLFLVVVSLGMLWATAQVPDIIRYNGAEHALLCNPLDPFFKQYPDKKPHGQVISSANWRGYVAAWEVKNQRLFLIDVTVEVSDKSQKYGYGEKSVLQEVFPGQKEVVADWFEGLLVIPMGKMVGYVHMGYGSTYEQYLLIQVKKGEVIKEKLFDNKEYLAFKKRQFQEFKKTQEYQDIIQRLRKNDTSGDPERSYDSFLFNYNIEYTTKFLVDLE